MYAKTSCPYCHNPKPEVAYDSAMELAFGHYHVFCSVCRASGAYRRTADEAVDAWELAHKLPPQVDTLDSIIDEIISVATRARRLTHSVTKNSQGATTEDGATVKGVLLRMCERCGTPFLGDAGHRFCWQGCANGPIVSEQVRDAAQMFNRKWTTTDQVALQMRFRDGYTPKGANVEVVDMTVPLALEDSILWRFPSASLLKLGIHARNIFGYSQTLAPATHATDLRCKWCETPLEVFSDHNGIYTRCDNSRCGQYQRAYDYAPDAPNVMTESYAKTLRSGAITLTD